MGSERRAFGGGDGRKSWRLAAILGVLDAIEANEFRMVLSAGMIFRISMRKSRTKTRNRNRPTAHIRMNAER